MSNDITGKTLDPLQNVSSPMTNEHPPVRRVMIVDDQEQIHEAFRTVLAPDDVSTIELDNLENALFGDDLDETEIRVPFELEFAFQGEEALGKLISAQEQGEPFAMAFVDMRMPPGWDGLETIERLWAVDPSLQVVICTAYSDYSWDNIIERLGHTDRLLLLKKPFASEEVYQLASALTEKRHLLHQSEEQVQVLRKTNLLLEEEVVQRREAEDRLRHEVLHDRLTGLPNRELLANRVEQCLKCREQDPDYSAALLFLDLDNFKIVNDSLGHSVGDELLIRVGERLQKCYRSEDTVSHENAYTAARFGGDEFVILMEDICDPINAEQVAERIGVALREPFLISDHKISVGTSIGIAILDRNVTTAGQLLRNADMAMYRAKVFGKNCYELFDQSMYNAALSRLEMENDLRRAVDQNLFKLFYQPLHDLKSGKMIGMESLIRWADPKRSAVGPSEFIPVAEEVGLIIPIGRWVLREACRALSDWNSVIPEENWISVSVNVSKRQIQNPNFVDELAAVLQEFGIRGNQINIEITESVIMENPESIVDRLHAIKKLGVELHMDDFGTGHSSLSCLQRFPIDLLKIDRSFVTTMKSDSDYESIIQAIIILAHNLRTKVIAEGIETAEQLAALQDLECDFGQGYYFSVPLSEGNMTALLMRYSQEMTDAKNDSQQSLVGV